MSEPSHPRAALHVLVQYCNDVNPARQAEYDECMRRNLANPQVIAVHNLVEPHTQVPPEFARHPKYRERTHPRWMTYADALAYANETLSGEVVALCNLDIFLGDEGVNWSDCRGVLNKDIVLCLARHEWDGTKVYDDAHLRRHAFCQTQDCWVFLAPILVPNCDFEIGMLGCDNAFASRVRAGGRCPVNWHDRFKVYHYDVARGKTSANQAAVHHAEAARRPANRHPEREGYLLLPTLHAFHGLDEVAKWLGMGDLERYALACELVSRFRTVTDDRP